MRGFKANTSNLKSVFIRIKAVVYILISLQQEKTCYFRNSMVSRRPNY